MASVSFFAQKQVPEIKARGGDGQGFKCVSIIMRNFAESTEEFHLHINLLDAEDIRKLADSFMLVGTQLFRHANGAPFETDGDSK